MKLDPNITKEASRLINQPHFGYILLCVVSAGVLPITYQTMYRSRPVDIEDVKQTAISSDIMAREQKTIEDDKKLKKKTFDDDLSVLLSTGL